MKRIQSIDLLRGIVMVLMAIDHARVFLYDSHGMSPENLSNTTPALFFTRWVTHFCAPVFIFLAGTSTFLMEQKWQSKKKVMSFLIPRGLILILLELTIFRLCWSRGGPIFDSNIELLVIWAIGITMIFLAFLIYLPYTVVLVFGLAILFLQNLLDNISFPEGSTKELFWSFFYKGGGGSLWGFNIFFLYPVLTYFGLAALGYYLGKIFTPAFPAEKRKRILLSMGICTIVLFIILRGFNIYGDPRPWQTQKNFLFSFMAILRTTKYPVSLLYALMTLGPALIVLALTEKAQNIVSRFFVTIGSVPMFYYVLHLPAFAILGRIVGYNKYNLFTMYLFFAAVVLLLYLLCRRYSKYKFEHPEKRWLKFL